MLLWENSLRFCYSSVSYYNFRKIKSLGKNFKFYIILLFFQNQVLSNLRKVFPLFLRNGLADSSEIFFTSSSAKLRCVFFFSARNLSPIKFGSLYKIRMNEKKRVFDKIFSILLLLADGIGIFQRKKKHAPRLGPSYHRKSFSSNG